MDINEAVSFIEVLESMNVRQVLISAFGIMLGAIGAVYASGRMLGLANTNRSRNLIGIAVMFIISFCITIRQNPAYAGDLSRFFSEIDRFIFLTDVLYKVLIACILYVLIGFSLYSRVDRLMDRKVGANDPSLDSCQDRKPRKK